VAEREIKRRESDIFKIESHNIQISHLLKVQREKVNSFISTFEEAVSELLNYSSDSITS
jgi:hypothetical protein